MIIVDSSAWIEFYRPSGSPGVRAVVAAAVDSDLVAVNGVIQVEVLAFSSRHDNRRKLVSDFEALGNDRMSTAGLRLFQVPHC